VIKIKLGDTGPFRRFQIGRVEKEESRVTQIWSTSENKYINGAFDVSYDKLVELVKQVVSQEVQEESLKLVYIDNEGDKVLITSDEDLQDAIIQHRGKAPPVVRIMLFKEKNVELDNSFKKEFDNIFKKEFLKKAKGSWKQRICKVEEEIQAMKSQIQELTLDKTNPSMVKAAVARTQDEEVAQIKDASVQVAPDDSARVNCPEDKPQPSTPTAPKKSPDVEISKPKQFSLECFNSKFIHGRHTCDGCYTTPIVGYRYNASNLPDYDLCQKCFNNYKGEDILFQPEQLERDEHLQRRWLVRYRNNEKAKADRAAIAAKRAEEERRRKEILEASAKCVDHALNEAIRRSLNDELKKKTVVPPPPSKPVSVPKEVMNVHSNSTTASDKTDVTPKQAGTQTHIADFESDVRSPSPKAIVHKTEPNRDHSAKANDCPSAGSGRSRKVPTTEVMIQPVVHLEINKPQLELAPSQSDDGDSDNFTSAYEEHEPDIIVAGEDYDAVSASSSSGSSSHWQVVDNDGAVNDEMVAQAAQLLGSALFQSDMAHDESGVDVHMTTESVSSGLTSVPTITSKSVISAVVLQRWEKELKQLHELGFLDDHANVDALGHFEAANIGVGETAPISIETVVAYLLNQKEEFEA